MRERRPMKQPCPECKKPVERLYYVIHPQTGAGVRVCAACESWLGRERDRLALTARRQRWERRAG